MLFTSSGTEAVEAALKLGRAATGRSRVISAQEGFHGLTLGSLSANGDGEVTERFGPLLAGFEQVPFGDLDALERSLRTEDVALFLVEPVQGKGVNLPPPGYLRGAQELCRRYGTLFCVDEVQTGLGRTGKLFAFEHWELEPDLVPIAKSLSGGYVPVGALLMSRAVHEAVFDSMEHAFSHGSTFAPNELAMAAGLATLHELDEQRLVQRSARLGEQLLALTRPLVERYDVVRDVRGSDCLGDRVRRAALRAAFVPARRPRPAGPVRAARDRPAVQGAPHPQPGRGPQDPRAQGNPAADALRGRRRMVRRALDETIRKAQRLPRALVKFALTAARIG